MPVHKRKYRSGKIVWFYQFDATGSTQTNRLLFKGSGFATKGEAVEAEATRRGDERQKLELAKKGLGVDAPVPKTLAALLDEFFERHAEQELAPKTIERYRNQAGYIDPALLQKPLPEITPLHLNREWARLLKNGGHTRYKIERPLSKKTVRNIAGVLSSAFSRAIKWGLLTTNPVTNSEPPKPKKRKGIALSPMQQSLLLEAATNPWCLKMFLQVSAATGARRGEVLALRWSDLKEGRATITRSLTQTRLGGVEFKEPKTDDSVRVVSLPASVLAALEAHRKRQDEFRQRFGPQYRADLDLVLANPDGTPLKPDSISSSVSALCRRLKLPKGVSLHTLRHSHGSHLLAAGVQLIDISERLGHSSVRVTADVYSHAIRGRDDEAARRWDKFQEGISTDQNRSQTHLT
jgi:integrase